MGFSDRAPDRTTGKRAKQRVTAELPDMLEEKARLSKTLHLIEKYLIQSFDCDRCSVLVIVNDKIKIVSETRFSEMPEETQFSCTAEDLKRLATIRWHDPPEISKEKISFYLNHDGTSLDSSIVSLIFIGDYLRGAIYLTRSDGRTFSDKDQQLLALFASRINRLIQEIIRCSHRHHLPQTG
ncbi:MAG: GAF domain-containing protein [Chloroflexota bacterium]